MSKVNDSDFDNLFETGGLIQFDHLYQTMKERKKNEYNFYNKVLEKLNNLSEEDKSKFGFNLMCIWSRIIKKYKKLQIF